MDFITEYYHLLDNWLRQSIFMIAMAQIATILTIFGDQINGVLRLFVKPYPFFLRVSAFVALCAFGYGAITAFSTPLYAGLLAKLNSFLLTPVVLVSFILIGMLAEHGIRLRSTRKSLI